MAKREATIHETDLAEMLRSAGLPLNLTCDEGQSGTSLAVMLEVEGMPYTIEGGGATDEDRIADVVRQFRALEARLRRSRE